MPLLKKSDAIKEEIERQGFIFNDCNGQIVRIPVFPMVLHCDMLDGKYWDKVKAIPSSESNNGYCIFFKAEDGKRKKISSDEISDIDENLYQSLVKQAETEGKLLKIKSIFLRAYP